jgi:hypothetical protein
MEKDAKGSHMEFTSMWINFLVLCCFANCNIRTSPNQQYVNKYISSKLTIFFDALVRKLYSYLVWNSNWILKDV